VSFLAAVRVILRAPAEVVDCVGMTHGFPYFDIDRYARRMENNTNEFGFKISPSARLYDPEGALEQAVLLRNAFYESALFFSIAGVGWSCYSVFRARALLHGKSQKID
jgi:hypothetical protein